MFWRRKKGVDRGPYPTVDELPPPRSETEWGSERVERVVVALENMRDYLDARDQKIFELELEYQRKCEELRECEEMLADKMKWYLREMNAMADKLKAVQAKEEEDKDVDVAVDE